MTTATPQVHKTGKIKLCHTSVFQLNAQNSQLLKPFYIKYITITMTTLLSKNSLLSTCTMTPFSSAPFLQLRNHSMERKKDETEM